MKRVCAALLCLLLAGLWGCGKQEAEAGPWGVDEPKYFDVEAYEREADDGPYPRNWNDAKELELRFTDKDEYNGYGELLIRDKATGETERVAKGSYSDCGGTALGVTKILSDTQFLYYKMDTDGGPDFYYLYDRRIGESVCVYSSVLGYLCDLGGGRYLWLDWDEDTWYTLYLIDMRALEAGEKDAKRTLVRWDWDCYATNICQLSPDKRFVSMVLIRQPDYTRFRGVYDVDTGEQVELIDYFTP